MTIIGCVHHKAAYKTPPPLSNPEMYLQEILAGSAQRSALSGYSKIKIYSGEKQLISKSIFFVKQPGFLRFEMLGLFNQPALFFVADEHTIKIFIPSENTFYQGASTDENIAALLGIKLRSKDIVTTYLGFPPGINCTASKISHVRDQDLYFFDISDNNTNHYVWIDPLYRRVVKYVLFYRGQRIYQLLFHNFIRAEGYLFPSKIEIEYFRHRTKIIAHNESLSGGTVPDDLFLLHPSQQAKVLPLDSFFQHRQ